MSGSNVKCCVQVLQRIFLQRKQSREYAATSIATTATITAITNSTTTVGRSGLGVAYLTAVHEVLGSNRTLGSCVYRTTTVIYSLGHELCAPFLQCLGQLSLLPSVGR